MVFMRMLALACYAVCTLALLYSSSLCKIYLLMYVGYGFAYQSISKYCQIHRIINLLKDTDDNDSQCRQ